MEMIEVTQTLVHIHKNMPNLVQEEQELAARFVLRTGDLELTNKLLADLSQPEAEPERIRQKFEVFMEEVSPLAEQLEGLLIALEEYRIQQEKKIQLLSGILLGSQAIKSKTDERNKQTAKKEQQEQEKEAKEEKEENHVGRNSAGGANYPGRL